MPRWGRHQMPLAFANHAAATSPVARPQTYQRTHSRTQRLSSVMAC